MTYRWDPQRRRSFLSLAAGAAAFGASRSAIADKSSRPFVLVLDAGHGGRNRGCRAVGGQLFEKHYTLAVCQKLKARLAGQKGLELHLTRRDDTELSSAQRIAIAQEVKADLVLSIHTNASSDHTQSGFESFVLCPERAQVRRMLDATSKSQHLTGSIDPVALRVANHQALVKEREARHFAAMLRDTQRQTFPGRIDRGVRYGRFDLLVECRRPTVLHELGFLDHRREGHWMQKADAMDRIVDTVANTVKRHLLHKRR